MQNCKMLYADTKDPDDIDDFSINWTNVLGSDTISAVSTSVVSGGVTLGTPSVSSATTTVRVSGGTDGTSAVVLFRITTSSGRQLDQTLTIPVQSL